MRSYIPQVVDSYRDEEQRFIHLGHRRPESALSLVQFGWHHTPVSYGYGPMVRDHCLIHFVLRGCGQVQTQGYTYRAEAGHCFALFPHQIAFYEADAADPWEYSWLGFEGEYAEGMLREMGFSEETTVLPIPLQDRILPILGQMREMEMSSAHVEFFIGNMHLLLYHMTQATPAKPRAMDRKASVLDNEYVRMVISIIETSYYERISIEGLANRLGLNRSYLSALFKRHTGKSIKDYLTEYRVEQAALRLQSTHHTVSSAAMECGFPDPLYFSRIFRKVKGMAPTDYRNWLRSQGPDSDET